MGMVHAIQKGDMPLSKASPRVRHVATSMNPKDVTEFAATKTKDLPEKVEEKKSASFLYLVARGMRKVADISGIMNKMRGTIAQTSTARRKHLEDHVKQLHKHSENLQKQLQKAQADAMVQKATSAAQAAAVPPMAPVPPPAQPAYGAMLQPGMQDQQGQQGKPAK